MNSAWSCPNDERIACSSSRTKDGAIYLDKCCHILAQATRCGSRHRPVPGAIRRQSGAFRTPHVSGSSLDVYQAREEIACLFGAPDPLRVIFGKTSRLQSTGYCMAFCIQATRGDIQHGA